jgi:hypothetical protein
MNSKNQRAQAIAALTAATAINGVVLHAAVNLANESWHPTEQAQVQKTNEEKS